MRVERGAVSTTQNHPIFLPLPNYLTKKILESLVNNNGTKLKQFFSNSSLYCKLAHRLQMG